jgi:hypothetical protein
MPADARLLNVRAPRWCRAVLAALAFGAPVLDAQTLSTRARENNCVDAPQVLAGTNVYKCNTSSGVPAMFNVPDPGGAERAPKRATGANGGNSPGAASAPVPSAAAAPATSLPRVDAATQKGRDDLRRRVLQDELAAEEKLLGESRTAYANGAPPALAEEHAQPQRYAERIARLRDAVLRHERNIEMLRRELGALR